ncbi:MAG: hypothetical protein ABJP34_13405 [Erythrobacter sp.]
MTSFRNMTSALIALSMVTVPVAAQAQTATTTASSSLSSTVMSYISTLCAQQAGGCILPLPNATPPPPPAPTPPPAPVVQAPPPPPAPAASGGFPFLPILLGLGAIAGGVLLLDDGDDDPISV